MHFSLARGSSMRRQQMQRRKREKLQLQALEGRHPQTLLSLHLQGEKCCVAQLKTHVGNDGIDSILAVMPWHLTVACRVFSYVKRECHPIQKHGAARYTCPRMSLFAVVNVKRQPCMVTSPNNCSIGYSMWVQACAC